MPQLGPKRQLQLQLLVALSCLLQLSSSCAVSTIRQLHTHITEGKLAAVRCSQLNIAAGRSLSDTRNFVECVPGSTKHTCVNNAACKGFRCSCADGLVYVPGVGCSDVNECQLDSMSPACKGSSASVTCVNTQGSFACNCTQIGQRYRPDRGCSDSPDCVFPFKYKGKSYSGCTSAGRGRLWCGVVGDVDANPSSWIECPLSLGNSHCAPMYTRNGESFSGCFIDLPTGRRICSLTADFDKDQLADLCVQM